MDYELRLEPDWLGHGPCWVARFADGVWVSSCAGAGDDPVTLDALLRELHEVAVEELSAVGAVGLHVASPRDLPGAVA